MNSHIYAPTIISFEQVPGEPFLLTCLQKQIVFAIGDKIIKKGRLILFRRVHYYIQISLMNEKNIRENFEIPIPFRVENYKEEGLLYFDYRLQSLNVKSLPRIPEKISSTYFNKILELSVA
jgi:hypothetical protein